jgi:3-deoxy-D-manno-octulosonate 8-phosphate phosphatase (KDO 8-P phosphatase)
MAIKDVRLLVVDVDGVLTDGLVYLGSAGEVIKAFHVRDGVGIKMLMDAGIECAFQSGRGDVLVDRRAAELGVRRVVSGVKDKAAALGELARSLGLELSQVGYVGDDLSDLPAMRACGWSACPADAAPEARAVAAYVASAAGGRGVVREIAERLLKEQGRWPVKG